MGVFFYPPEEACVRAFLRLAQVFFGSPALATKDDAAG